MKATHEKLELLTDFLFFQVHNLPAPKTPRMAASTTTKDSVISSTNVTMESLLQSCAPTAWCLTPRLGRSTSATNPST